MVHLNKNGHQFGCYANITQPFCAIKFQSPNFLITVFFLFFVVLLIFNLEMYMHKFKVFVNIFGMISTNLMGIVPCLEDGSR